MNRRSFLKGLAAVALAPLLPPLPTQAQPARIRYSDAEKEAIIAEAMEARPPGCICPVCASCDVDMNGTRGICHNSECGSEWEMRFEVSVKKWEDFGL